MSGVLDNGVLGAQSQLGGADNSEWRLQRALELAIGSSEQYAKTSEILTRAEAFDAFLKGSHEA